MPFVPDPSTLLAFVAAAVVLALTPGPDMALFLGKTLGQGRAAGFAAFFGAVTGVVLHTALAALGLSALLAASEQAFAMLKLVGALYLLWLAWAALRHGSSLALERTAQAPQPLSEVFLMGLGINLLNPKIVLFFVTFLPQFVDPGDAHAAGKLAFLGMTFILTAIPICAALILAADRLAGSLRGSRRVTRVLDWLFAGLMGGFAVKILLTRAS